MGVIWILVYFKVKREIKSTGVNNCIIGTTKLQLMLWFWLVMIMVTNWQFYIQQNAKILMVN